MAVKTLAVILQNMAWCICQCLSRKHRLHLFTKETVNALPIYRDLLLGHGVNETGSGRVQ